MWKSIAKHQNLLSIVFVSLGTWGDNDDGVRETRGVQSTLYCHELKPRNMGRQRLCAVLWVWHDSLVSVSVADLRYCANV